MYSSKMAEAADAGDAMRAHQVSLWAKEVLDFSSQYNAYGWSAASALGAPRVFPQYGDIQGAWAQENITDHEFIALGFEDAIFVDKLEVYETFHAGAIMRVSFRDEENQWHTAWTSKKAAERICHSRVNKIAIEPTDYKVNGVRLDLDLTAAGTWAEIDAVKLTGVYLRVDNPPPISELINALGTLVNSPNFSDVTFEVDGRQVHAHKAILSARSDYFRAMFSDDTEKFCQAPEQNRKVEGITYEAFMGIMQYIYTNNLTLPPAPEHIVEIIRAADMYSMSGLRKLGIYHLYNHIAVPNVISIYRQVTEELPVIEEVEDMCIKFIAANMAEVSKTDVFCKLPQPVLLDIVHKCAGKLTLK